MAKRGTRQRRERVSARKRAAAAVAGRGGPSYLKVPDGVSMFKVDKKRKLLDILLYKTGKGNPNAEEGQPYYERTFYIHNNVGPENKRIVCPQKSLGLPCPICDYRKALINEDYDKHKTLIGQLRPKERQLWAVIDRADSDAGFKVWDESAFLFGELLFTRIDDCDEGDDYEYFAETEDGLTLRCSFKEEEFSGNKYWKCVSIDFKPRPGEYDDSIIDDAPCLDDMLLIHTEDEIKKMFLEIDTEEDEDEEDEKPKRSRRSSRKKKKEEPAPEEDDDEGADDDWDEDDEEEEKEPPKKKRGKSGAGKKQKKPEPEPEEDDDDDWDDEDEDEKEEPPKKERTTKNKKKSKPEPEPDEDDDDWDDDWDEDDD